MPAGASAAPQPKRGQRQKQGKTDRPVRRQQAAHNNVAPVRKRLAILAAVCLTALAPAMPAVAAGLAPPVADCYAHGGQLTKTYTAAQLKNGLSTMPADIREYSPCYDTLQRALLNLIHGLNGGGTGGGGSFLPVWLIVVLALLVLGGAGLGIVAVRNRGQRA
jgi:hypothetical protein